MNQVFLLLGSNINKEINVPLAVGMVNEHVGIVRLSSVYETMPIGLKDQPNFFNLAILIETELSPSQIKQQLIDRIEQALNRERQADKNAPRTIDLDIILYGDAVLDYEGGDGRIRQIPDPELLRFVHIAIPIAELAPDMVHPVTGQTMADLAQKLFAAANSAGDMAIWKREDMNLTKDLELT